MTLLGQAENRLSYILIPIYGMFPGHSELKDETACLTVLRILQILYYSWLTNNSSFNGTKTLPPVDGVLIPVM